jgi:hypothetical protein
MSWWQPIAYIDGNPQNSQLWREALQAATEFNQGIVSPSDLKVTATSPTSLVLNIASGSAIILGDETANQGSYFGVNIGADTVTLAAGGASIRYDLIVAQVQDPTFSGSSWSHNPATDQLIYSTVVSGVSSGTTQPPNGMSAIPLALVQVPIGASVISQANITDLRSLANPPSQSGTIAQMGASSSSIAGNQASAVAWPTWFSSSVTIPEWATHMRITAIWNRYQPASAGSATTGPKITVKVAIGSLFTQTMLLDDSWLAFSSGEVNPRLIGMVADTVNVTTIAGTTVSLVPTAIGQASPGTATGTDVMDTSSMMIIQYEFLAEAV